MKCCGIVFIMCENSLLLSELQALPWVALKMADSKHLIKYCFQSTRYCIMVSDLINAYYEEMHDSLILEKCAKLNPKIEIELSDVLKEIESSLTKWVNDANPEGSEFPAVNQSATSFQLKCTSFLTNVAFVWEFNMKVVDTSTFFLHVVQPLFGFAHEMKRRNAELMKIIAKKDAEIEDYKTSGAKITFKYLETEKFVPNVFQESMNNPQDIKQLFKLPAGTIFEDSTYKNVVSALHPSKVELTSTETTAVIAAADVCKVEKSVKREASELNAEEPCNESSSLHDRPKPLQMVPVCVEKKPMKKMKKAFKF